MPDFIKKHTTTKYCKKYVECKLCEKKHSECRVFPDVIVHKRGTKKYNLLVVEAKIKVSAMSRQSQEDKNKIKNDKNKIEEYLTDDNLKYQYGLFISFEDSISDTLKELRWCQLDDDRKPQWFDNDQLPISWADIEA